MEVRAEGKLRLGERHLSQSFFKLCLEKKEKKEKQNCSTLPPTVIRVRGEFNTTLVKRSNKSHNTLSHTKFPSYKQRQSTCTQQSVLPLTPRETNLDTSYSYCDHHVESESCFTNPSTTSKVTENNETVRCTHRFPN